MDRLGTVASKLPSRGVKLLRRLTRRSSSNFAFAFFFLAPQQRDALKRIYEFCRVVDDIVDERPPGDEGIAAAREGLARWRDEVAAIYGEGPHAGAPQTQLGGELAESRKLFDYPRKAFDEIIAGCEMDLERPRYADMDELRLYCYRVASCVGLLCIAIFGDTSPAAQDYAEHLGLALQLTNILRDVGEDAMRGRIYRPAVAPAAAWDRRGRDPAAALRRPLRRARDRLRRRGRARVPARVGVARSRRRAGALARRGHGPHVSPHPGRDPRPPVQRLHPSRRAASPRQAQGRRAGDRARRLRPAPLKR